MITERDLKYLRRCVELARSGMTKGNSPFGSLLLSAEGEVLFEGHNETAGGDETLHPEIEIARWASLHMKPEARAGATVYTSGEHCPMCAAAHGWAGLGRIVYASSSEQLHSWLDDWGLPHGRVRGLPIRDVINEVVVDGPAPTLTAEIKALQRRYFGVEADRKSV